MGDKQDVLIKKSDEEKIESIVSDLLGFFEKDIPNVIDYINDEEDPIPVEYITPNKRIDLHPTREYLLRLPRILNEVAQLKEKLDPDDEDDDFNIY
jgi:hypothetical protein